MIDDGHEDVVSTGQDASVGNLSVAVGCEAHRSKFEIPDL